MRVPEAFRRGIRPGHTDAGNVLATEGVGGKRGHERRVNATAQADNRFLETALGHVVPCPEHKRLINGGGFRGRGRMEFRSAFGIEDDQVLLEGFRPGDHSPLRVERHARAVEDELVVSSDVVDVNNGNGVARS